MSPSNGHWVAFPFKPASQPAATPAPGVWFDGLHGFVLCVCWVRAAVASTDRIGRDEGVGGCSKVETPDCIIYIHCSSRPNWSYFDTKTALWPKWYFTFYHIYSPWTCRWQIISGNRHLMACFINKLFNVSVSLAGAPRFMWAPNGYHIFFSSSICWAPECNWWLVISIKYLSKLFMARYAFQGFGLAVMVAARAKWLRGDWGPGRFYIHFRIIIFNM